MRESLISASLFLFLTICAIVPQANANSQADDFVAKAMSLNLEKSRMWWILLHYKDLSVIIESQIDDPSFFMASDGKLNPEAELEATIRGFFYTDAKGDEHPKCRFPARYHWLDSQIGLSSSTPAVTCSALDKAMENVNPTSVSMVFASAHINSPASMFGHPLIRIDSQKESKLLAQAVNYAAQTGESMGLLFAFYGIFGYYTGLYSLMPYYEKVSEYNDFDMRDLWEYHLDLSPEEARMMLRHLWELKDKYSYYYFLDENCASIILYLIEAARPSLDLTSRWGAFVIPVDSLRRVVDSGIVTKVTYRASKMTKMRALSDSMTSEEISVSKNITKGKVSAKQGAASLKNPDSRKKALDLAAELLQMKYSAKKLEQKPYQKMFLATLRERGRIGGDTPEIKEIVPPVRPDLGHLSAMFSMGLESNDGPKGNRPVISIRPSLHDLMDPQEGYVAGSQIEFISLTCSFQPIRSKLWLERLNLVNIVSLSPVNELFTPVSWKVRLGLDRREFANGDVSEAFFLNTGGGFSSEVGGIGLAYAFLEADLQANHNFDNGYAAGPAFSLGLIIDPFPGWKTGIRARVVQFLTGSEEPEYELSFSERYSFDQKFGIQVDLKGAKIGEREIRSAFLKLVLFL